MLTAFLDRLLQDRTDRSRRISLAVLLGFVAVLAGILRWTGSSFQTDMAWDAIIMLEAGTRWLQGQIPHVDYLSPIGILPTWLMSVALRLSRGTAHALAYAPLLVVFPVAIAGWWVAQRRLSAWLSLGFAGFLAALVTATRPLPFGMLPYPVEFMHTSYAMAYNRLGWALLIILVLQQFVPARARAAAPASRLEAAGAGAVCVLLLLTKVNYAAAAAGVVLVGLVIARPTRGATVALLVGAVAAVGLAIVLLRFHPGAWWREFSYLGQVNPLVTRVGQFGEGLLRETLAGLLTLAGIVLAWPLLRLRPRHEADLAGPRVVLLGLAAAACGLCVLTFNAQRSETPLFALALLVVAELAARRLDSRDRPEHALRVRHRAVVGLAAALGAVTFGSDLASIVWSAAYARHMRASTPAGQTLAGPTLAPLLLPPLRYEEADADKVRIRLSQTGAPATPYQYGVIVNDGLRLLGPLAGGRSRILCLDLVNPFPFAQQSPYPTGGSLWWAWNTFSRTRHPAPASVLRDATHVMIPKVPIVSADEVPTLLRLLQPELDRDFTTVGETAFWLLLRRR
jgi:hypothetical protein